jgi:hypothetical protein
MIVEPMDGGSFMDGTARTLTVALAFSLGCCGGAAADYKCAVSSDNRSVIVTFTNRDAVAKFCTVNCTFNRPVGSVSLSCSNTVPPNVQDWEFCVQPKNAEVFTFFSGEESCTNR